MTLWSWTTVGSWFLEILSTKAIMSIASLLLDGTSQQKWASNSFFPTVDGLLPYMLCRLLYSNCPITSVKWCSSNIPTIRPCSKYQGPLGGHEINKRTTSFGLNLHNVLLALCSNLGSFIDSLGSIVWCLIFRLRWTKLLETILKLYSDYCCNYVGASHIGLGGGHSMHIIGYRILCNA